MTKHLYTLILLLLSMTVRSQVSLSGTTKINSGGVGCYNASTSCSKTGICWTTTSGTLTSAGNCGLNMAIAKQASPQTSKIIPNILPGGGCTGATTTGVQFPTVSTLTTASVHVQDNCGSTANLSVTIVPPLANNATVSPASESVTCNATPGLLTAGNPSGGDGTYSYSWQYSPDNTTWTAISGATAKTYQPPANPYPYYRVIVSSFDYSVTSSVATITTTPPAFSPGYMLNPTQTILSGTAPAQILCTPASGGVCSGTPVYTSIWKSSTDGAFYSSTGVTTQNYTPGPLTVTTYFMRTDTYTGAGGLVTVVNSNVATVTVVPPVAGGTIATSSNGTNIYSWAQITSTQAATGGLCGGSYTYTWWQSADGVNFTQLMWASNSPTLQTASLSAPAYFKRMVSCAGASASSNIVEVLVHQPLTPGTLTPSVLTIPSGASPGLLTANDATGGGCSGAYTYDWQWSQDNATWHDAAVATPNYTPGAITQLTYYRRMVTCGPDQLYTNICAVNVGAPDTTTPSYLQTRDILKPGILSAAGTTSLTSPFDVHQTTQFFDGAGRIEQQVEKQASPLQYDMVTVSTFDQLWLESVRYLPYTSAGNNGNFKTNPLVEQQSFNTAQFPGEQSFYGQVDHEPSPLGRVTATYSPGINFVGAGRSITNQYLENEAPEGVIIWNIAAAQGSLPVNGGTYNYGMLNKTIKTDEAGMKVIEYTDFNGQLVLRKVQVAATPGIDHTGWKCTYYVYDDMHRKRFVITPEAVMQYLAGTPLSSISDALCFRFEYDAMGRLIIRKDPGAAESWIVYDGANRVVLTQDGNQRLTNQWMYMKYDNWNRPIMTGIYTDNTNLTQATMQTYEIAQGLRLYETYAPTSFPVYTLNQSFPANADQSTVMSYTYYDDYAWTSWYGSQFAAKDNSYDNQFAAAGNSAYPYPRALTQSNQTQARVTGVWSRIANSPQGNLMVNYYDDRGRIIQHQELNSLGGTDITTQQFSFSGRLLQTVRRHQLTGVTNPQTHTVTEKLTYDHMGRLLTTTRSLTSVINGRPALTRGPRVETTLTYNERGALATRTLGTGIETQTFDYTVRGRLRGMNRNYVNGSPTGNMFGYELGYDNPTGVANATYTKPNYTGDVAGTVWMSAGDGIARKFDYSYDNLNELTGAAFTQYGGSAGWNSSTLDFSVSGLSYDLNGNLMGMTQKGWKQGSVTTIDQLQYTYPANSYGNTSNQLQNVVDYANDPNTTLGDFHYASTTKTTGATDYTYDPAGNLLTDANKNLTITYNYLGLAQHIAIGTKGTIDYGYDATGAKQWKTVTDNSVAGKTVTTTTNYIGEFEYSSRTTVPTDPNNPNYTNVPQRLLTDEGRLRYITDNNFNVTDIVGDYFLKDYLGNVRMVLTDTTVVDIYPAATLEGTGASTDPIAVEQNFYTINTGQVVNNSAATGITAYQNNNGNPPANNNPNCNNTSVIKQTDLSQKLYRINESNTGKTGLGVTIRVMSGDRIDIFGKSYYTQLNTGGAPANVSMAVSDIVSGLLAAPGNMATERITAGQMQANTNGVVTPLNTFIGKHDNTGSESTPRAYINYVFFDDQFNYAGSGTSQVGSANTVKSHSGDASMQGIIAPKNGYIYIFCSNESPVDVFFDNLQVIHTHSKLLEESHYYPFGLTMAAISSQAYNVPINRYKYQGKELNNQELADGTGLENYDFDARHYDHQIGRWHNPDPASQFASPYMAMGNTWPNGTDPNGKIFGLDDLVLGIVGGIVNLGTQLLSGTPMSLGQAFGYFGVGFVSGVSAEYTGPMGAGAIAGFGNALVAGKSLGDAFQSAAVGAIGGAVAGPIASSISPYIGQLTSGLGVTVSNIVTTLGTNTITGGLIGGGLSAMQGGSFSKGFGQGALSGFAGTALGMGAFGIINAANPNPQENPTAGDPNDDLPSPPKADPNNIPLAKTTDDNNPPSPANAAGEVETQNPVWNIPGNSPRGFAVEQIRIDDSYKGWTHLPNARTIDGQSADLTQVVSIKSTMAARLNVTQNIIRLSELKADTKILDVVTPRNHVITNWPQIQALCTEYGITLVRSYL